MRTSEALNFFGGDKRKLAQIAGLTTVNTVYKWGELVPENRARRLHDATNGALKYDQAVYDLHREKQRNMQRQRRLKNANQSSN